MNSFIRHALLSLFAGILLFLIILYRPDIIFADVKDLIEKAEKGDKNAQNSLGLIFYYGEEVTKDFTEAAKWYRLAADQGYAYAQFNLGGMYYSGEGVTKDFTEAVKWFRLAADQGLAEAKKYSWRNVL
jgi:TPR repeat protein